MMSSASTRAVTAILLMLGVLCAGAAAPAATFDGDARADLAVYRPGNGTWYVLRSGGGTTETPWGIATDNAVPGDYDGDGTTDIAVFRPGNGTWYVLRAAGGAAETAWGTEGDIPVPADFDGDGTTDIAVFRPGNGTWYVLRSGGGTTETAWGTQGDVPAPGDYDGDGTIDLAVFRPSNGTWYALGSASGASETAWGTQGDVPVPGDYDGDGRTDLAVFRPSNGTWYVIGSTAGATETAWGTDGDVPVPADYDGDGRTDAAVFRPSNGTWYVIGSTDGPFEAAWGTRDDVPARPPAHVPQSARTFDLGSYLPFAPGSIRLMQNGEAAIDLRVEPDSAGDNPVYRARHFGPGDLAWDELLQFDPVDGTYRLYGRVEGTPPVLYRFEPAPVLGTSTVKIGDAFNNAYLAVNTTTGDSTDRLFNARVAAVERVVTPAGTFDNCLRYEITDDGGGWTGWFAPGVGLVKKSRGAESNAAVYIGTSEGVEFGSPPARTLSDISGVFDVDLNLTTSGSRWEKNIFNVVHDTGTDNLAITRFRPNGGQAPRSGALSGTALTIQGLSDAGPSTFEGVVTPNGKALLGRFRLDETPGEAYAVAGTVVAPVGRGDGDETVAWSPDWGPGYLRTAFSYPLMYNGLDNSWREDRYAGMDIGAELVGRAWWNLGSTFGLLLTGDTDAGGPIPYLRMVANRFALGDVYTNYDRGEGNVRTIRIDAVDKVAVPHGTFPLALRGNIQDNVAGTISNKFFWLNPGVPARVAYLDNGARQELVSYKAGAGVAGNRPSPTPFTFLFGAYDYYSHLSVQDDVDGWQYYFFQLRIANPDNTIITDWAAFTDFRLYAWPSMTEVSVDWSWTYLVVADALSVDFDGNGGNPPAPYPVSHIEGYTSGDIGTIKPGIFKAVVTDDTGQQQSAWLFFDNPTETGKVQSSGMSYQQNEDGSLTLSWETPSPAPDPSKHILRLYVSDGSDPNGDGSDDVLLATELPADAASYTIPAEAAAGISLAAYPYWYVQVREAVRNVVNPDLTTSEYHTYQNDGQRQYLPGSGPM